MGIAHQIRCRVQFVGVVCANSGLVSLEVGDSESSAIGCFTRKWLAALWGTLYPCCDLTLCVRAFVRVFVCVDLKVTRSVCDAIQMSMQTEGEDFGVEVAIIDNDTGKVRKINTVGRHDVSVWNSSLIVTVCMCFFSLIFCPDCPGASRRNCSVGWYGRTICPAPSQGRW